MPRAISPSPPWRNLNKKNNMRCCFPRHIATFLGVAALMGDRLGAATFEEYVSGYGLSGTNATTLADPDGDGIVNVLEYMLDGMNPTIPDALGNHLAMVFGSREDDTVIPQKDISVIVLEDWTSPPKTGRWYIGARYKPRAGTTGWRIFPQYAYFSSEMRYWLDGPAAFSPRIAPDEQGRVVQWFYGMFSPRIWPKKSFIRLKVQEVAE